MPRAILAFAAFLVAGLQAADAGSLARVETGHIEAEFVARQAQVAPGDTVEIAIRHELADGWYTYWKNPGDSGGPPEFEWDLPDDAAAAQLRYPAPQRIPYPPLMTYGYKGAFTLLTAIDIPSTWPAGKPFPVSVRGDWLVCEDICIPESGATSFTVPTGSASAADSSVAFTFVQAEWAMPEDGLDAATDARATYTVNGDTLRLASPVGSPEDAYFFPHDRDAIDHAAEQSTHYRPDTPETPGVTLDIPRGRGPLDGTLSGVLSTAEGAWRIVATGDPAPSPTLAAGTSGGEGARDANGGGGQSRTAPAGPAASGPESAVGGASPAGSAVSSIGSGRLTEIGVWRAIGFAFLGGIILNLMPCVFPVLALKALGLISHAASRPVARVAHAGAYTGGILVCFGLLAGVLLVLEAAGVAAGWGFQLQSPGFVGAMALILFAVGLNLSGVFEIGTGLTRLGGAGPREGYAGSFATGALATVVATPCTAPFMAAAIGAALAAPPIVMLAVFAGLGLGLAAPFVCLAIVPGLARALPRPGVWMERVKQALAFPMYATAAWLVWVLAQLSGVDALVPAFAALILTALAAWLFGLSQRGGGSSHRVATGLAAAALIAGVAALWPAATGTPAAAVARAEASTIGEPFSPERLAALREDGQPVLVNVTAAWCITCKMNERTVFEREAFRDIARESGVTYLVADWTRRDPVITAFLNRFGRAGVPLYVYVDAEGQTTLLPQILTLSAVRDALEG